MSNWTTDYYGVEDTASRRAHRTHPLEQTEARRNTAIQNADARHRVGIVSRNYDEELEYEVVPLASAEVQSCPLPWVDHHIPTHAQWTFYTGEDGGTLYDQPHWHRRRWTDAQHDAFADFMAEIKLDTTSAAGIVIKNNEPPKPAPPKPRPAKKKKKQKKKKEPPRVSPGPIEMAPRREPKERRIRPPRQTGDQAFCRDCVGVPATMKLDTGLYQCDECDELFSHDPQRWTHIKGW